MKFAADSSALLRLYLDADGAEALERFLVKDAKVISVSELAHIEVLNVLLRGADAASADKFEEDLAEGLRLRLDPVDWSDAFRQGGSLARRFSRTLRPGGHDLIMVAAAVATGASWFLSFDSNSRQRPLAAAAGLRVWPPLGKDEKGLVRHAARRVGDRA